MAKIGAGSTFYKPTFNELRRKLDNYRESGLLNLVMTSQVIARANGTIKVDLTSRTMPDFTSYVNAGAKLLDEQDPGWWRAMDVTMLDLDDENFCLLGQSWGHYVEGRKIANAVVDTNSVKTATPGALVTNFTRFLNHLFPSLDSDQNRREEAACYGFQLPEQVITWINYEGRRKEQETGRLKNDAGRGWSWALLDEVWEHLTATWIVLIQARQQAAEEQVQTLAADLIGLSREEIARKVLEHRN